MILLMVLILLLLCGGGLGYNRWGSYGGLGVGGVVLVILLLCWILGAFGPGPALWRIR